MMNMVRFQIWDGGVFLCIGATLSSGIASVKMFEGLDTLLSAAKSFREQVMLYSWRKLRESE